MKSCTAFLLALILILTPSAALAAGGYQDVPENSWAVSAIQSATQKGLINGIKPGVFGYGHTVTRAQFATILARMFHWDTPDADPGFADTKGHWAAKYIAAAVREGVVQKVTNFRPEAPVKREEMAIMLVRALGYEDLAQTAAGYPLPFTDMTYSRGYVAIAYDIGMTNGVTADRFAPRSPATREQAAAMMVRIDDKYTAKTQWLHGFYAISSYSQIGLTKEMDAVSLGWSRMIYDPAAGPVLSTKRTDGNVYAIPGGYADAVRTMQANGCALNLSVFMGNQGKALASLLSDPTARTTAVEAIVTEATRLYDDLGTSPYTGVTIDFEGLAGASNRTNFNAFLTELDQALDRAGRTLTVMVMPASSDGAYYDGYDYRTIGDLADKVILMAHDYQPSTLTGFVGTTYYKNAALTPLPSVYFPTEERRDREDRRREQGLRSDRERSDRTGHRSCRTWQFRLRT